MYHKKKANLMNSMEQIVGKKSKQPGEKVIKLGNMYSKLNVTKDITFMDKSATNLKQVEIRNEDAEEEKTQEEQKLSSETSIKLRKEDSPKTQLKKLIFSQS